MSKVKTTASDLAWGSVGDCKVVVQNNLPASHVDAALMKHPFSLDRFKPLKVLGRSSKDTRILLVRSCFWRLLSHNLRTHRIMANRICVDFQVQDTETGREVAAKAMCLKHISPQQKHQVLRGCRVQVACAKAEHILPFYAALEVRRRSFMISVGQKCPFSE